VTLVGRNVYIRGLRNHRKIHRIMYFLIVNWGEVLDVLVSLQLSMYSCLLLQRSAVVSNDWCSEESGAFRIQWAVRDL